MGPLYPRFASFYFLYFAAVGILLPYWSPYLAALGFGAAAIGELLAFQQLARLIGPNVWGWLVDRSGRRMPWVRAAALLAGVVLLPLLLLPTSYGLLVAVMLGFGFFFSAVLAPFEATTLDFLRRGERYAALRLWGSVGFIVASLGAGYWIELSGPLLTPALLVGCLALLVIIGLGVPEQPRPQRHDSPSDGRLGARFRDPQVWAVLLAGLFMQASHGTYYGFFSIHLNDLGYSPELIGGLWSLGVVAEVILFAVLGPLAIIERVGVRRLLLWTFALTVLRWLMIGFQAESLLLLLLAQGLHAVSFGMHHAVSIALVYRLFPPQVQARGQALFGSLGYGIGGALGSFLAGRVWAWGGALPGFGLAAGLALIGGVAVWVLLRPPDAMSAGG